MTNTTPIGTTPTGKTVLGYELFENHGEAAKRCPFFLRGPRGKTVGLFRTEKDENLLYVVNAGRHVSTWNVKGYQWFVIENGEVKPHA